MYMQHITCTHVVRTYTEHLVKQSSDLRTEVQFLILSHFKVS